MLLKRLVYGGRDAVVNSGGPDFLPGTQKRVGNLLRLIVDER